MSRPTKNFGSIFKKLEKFVGFKYPTFIKEILLNTGFDCEHAIKTIDENTIPIIEKKVELDHPNLLEGTIYEPKLENHLPFKFLIGHRALILEIPLTLDKYLKKKSEKKPRSEIQPEIQPENLKVLLINTIKTHLNNKKINCDFNIENVCDISQKENRFRCLVKCVFCEVKTPCIFDKHWKISNYSKHVCGHTSEKTRGLASVTSKNPLEPKEAKYHRARPNVIYEVRSVLNK